MRKIGILKLSRIFFGKSKLFRYCGKELYEIVKGNLTCVFSLTSIDLSKFFLLKF